MVWQAVIFTLIGAVGLLTNAVVVFVMLKSKSLMRTESSKFLVNQSLIDALTSFLVITSHTNLVDYLQVVQDNYKDNNIGDELLCRFWNFDLIQWSFNTASTINLVVMTLEKYLKIVHPMWYRAKVHTVHHRVALALPWLLGPIYQLTIYLHTLDVIDNVCVLHIWPSILLSRIAGVFAVSFEFFIPITLFIFCYSRVLNTLRTRFQKLAMPDEASSSSQGVKKCTESVSKDGDKIDVAEIKDGSPTGNRKDCTVDKKHGQELAGQANPGFTDIMQEGVDASGKPDDMNDDDQQTHPSGKTSLEKLDVMKLAKNAKNKSQQNAHTRSEDAEATSTVCCFNKKKNYGRTLSTKTAKEESGNSSIDKKNLKSQRKVIRILITVAVAFFLCWVCNQTILFLTNIGLVGGDIFYSFIYTISGITAYMNCCVNPFIYVAQFKKFRSAAYYGFFKCNWNN